MRSTMRRACWALTRSHRSGAGSEGPLDLALRDGVEDHPLGLRGDAQFLREVPGDGLALAVEVGCEPDLAVRLFAAASDR
jgi:hypothetical protein